MSLPCGYEHLLVLHCIIWYALYEITKPVGLGKNDVLVTNSQVHVLKLFNINYQSVTAYTPALWHADRKDKAQDRTGRDESLLV